MLNVKFKLLALIFSITFLKVYSQEGYTPYVNVPPPNCSNCRTGVATYDGPYPSSSQYDSYNMHSPLGNFGNTPVDFYTGTPSISIPLYEVKARDYSLPISMNYDPSGVKVQQEADWLGLGWSVGGIPTISRVVRGGDDFRSYSTDNIDKYSSYLWASLIDCPQISHSWNSCMSASTDYHQTSLHSTISNEKDLQTDIFSVNLGGQSYKFILDHSRATNRQVILLNKHHVKISLIFTNNVLVPSIELITSNGTKYYFGEVPGAVYSTSRYLGTKAYTSIATFSEIRTITSGTQNVVYDDIATQWHVRKIVTPMGDEINFNYQSMVYNSINSQSDESYIYETLTDLQNAVPNKTTLVQKTLKREEAKIKDILFPLGKITFVVGSTLRPDIYNTSAYPLKFIEVYDTYANPQKLVNKYSFEHDYFNSGLSSSSDAVKRQYLRLKLTKVNALDVNTGDVLPQHSFNYNESLVIGNVSGIPIYLPLKNSCAIDHWGYYNNKNLSETKLKATKENVDVNGVSVNFNGLDRDIDVTYSQIGILKRIIYPTGGYSEYTYENNDYNSPSSSKKTVGGLRIKQVRISDGDNNSSNDIYKLYNYVLTDAQGNSTTNSSGVLMENVMYTRVPYYQLVEGYEPEEHAPSVYEGGLPLVNTKGYPVIRSSQSFLPEGIHSSGNIVGYSEVQVLEGLNGELGKNIYKYHALPNFYFGSNPYIENEGNFPPRTYYEYVYNNIEKLTVGNYSSLMYVRNGLLKENIQYKKVGSLFNIIKRIENSYNNVAANSSFGYSVISSKQNVIITGIYRNSSVTLPTSSGYCSTSFQDCYRIDLLVYSTPYLRLKLSSVKETTYDPSDPTKYISSLTTYEYDNTSHLQLKKVCQNPGEKGSICTEFSYPADYSRTTPTTNALMDMKSSTRNMQDAVIERVVKKDIAGDGVYKVMQASYSEYKWATTSTSPIVLYKTWNLETDVPLTETTNYAQSSTNGYFMKSQNFWSGYDMIATDNNYPTTPNQTYDSYDVKGNLLQYSNEGNISTSFLYGYAKTIPIAKVNNATISQFSYSGFESGSTMDDDGWDLSSCTILDGDIAANKGKVYSGRYSASSMNGPTKNVTPSSQTGKYKLSCYIKTDGVSGNAGWLIAYTILSGGTYDLYPNIPQANMSTPLNHTNGQWQYYEVVIDLDYIRQSQNISPSTILSLRCFVANGYSTPIYVDDIRVHPVDAEMTTNSYKPLVGKISESDINHTTTFIEYDGFNRVRLIRDQDGNILKKYKYFYRPR